MLTIQQAKDLTAMLWGAPVSTNEAKGLIVAIAMNDYLRSTGTLPVDPATRSRMKDALQLPAHIEELIERL